MNTFTSTHSLFQSKATSSEAKPEHIAPPELRELLQTFGQNVYAQGFFRFVVPAQFRGYTSLWNLPPERCVPFMKCAFGHIILFHDHMYKAINPVHNNVDELAGEGELDFVMDILLTDRPALESSFLIDLYEQSVGRLGIPSENEIYALVPALRLGGPRAAQRVERLKMLPEMQILSQL